MFQTVVDMIKLHSNSPPLAGGIGAVSVTDAEVGMDGRVAGRVAAKIAWTREMTEAHDTK